MRVRSMVAIVPILILMAVWSGPGLPASEQELSGPETRRVTRIVLLGTGTPNSEPDRFGPAVAIVVNQTPYLVDCGAGVVRRAAAAFQGGVQGLELKNLKRLFVTHLHSDHTVGYPDLILTPWVLDRDEPLKVFGPEGIRRMTDHLLEAYRDDIQMRLYGQEPANNKGHRVQVHEIKPGMIYQDGNVTVEAIPVKHGTWPEAFGFKFITPDRTIVISGDTVPVEDLIQAAHGVDVLIHEVYSREAFQKRSAFWQTYHSHNHTSTHELADIANRARPGLLILYHQLYWGQTDAGLLAEIGEKYDGKVVSGKDLEVY